MSFWGLIIEPNETYEQTLEKPLHLSMATLDACTTTENLVQVMVSHDNFNYVLCSLQKGSIWQVSLDLNFEKGTKITFTCNGGGHVHLTGYFKTDDEERDRPNNRRNDRYDDRYNDRYDDDSDDDYDDDYDDDDDDEYYDDRDDYYGGPNYHDGYHDQYDNEVLIEPPAPIPRQVINPPRAVDNPNNYNNYNNNPNNYQDNRQNGNLLPNFNQLPRVPNNNVPNNNQNYNQNGNLPQDLNKVTKPAENKAPTNNQNQENNGNNLQQDLNQIRKEAENNAANNNLNQQNMNFLRGMIPENRYANKNIYYSLCPNPVQYAPPAMAPAYIMPDLPPPPAPAPAPYYNMPPYYVHL